jgi:acetyl-CoA synthetase
MRAHQIADVDDLLKRSINDQHWFWDAIVHDLGIQFAEPYHTVLDTADGVPWADWYVGGRINIVANCLDRHATGDAAHRTSVIAEREDGTIDSLTYAELAALVDRCAAGLQSLGVGRGDRVAAYMPTTADVVVQMLATLKLGAIFVPIFIGFAPAAVAQRLRDAEAKVLFTADGCHRRGDTVPVKGNAEAAVDEAPSIKHVVVMRYTDDDIVWEAERDVWWGDLMSRGDEARTVLVGSMDPALILYTAGTSGLPKGTVHSHAGALVQIAKETAYAFDLKPDDRLFWLADIGWMMGPWSIIGSLFHGATVVLYNGVWDYPRSDRLWEMVARHRVTIFGVSPFTIRILMQRPDTEVAQHDLSSLRILGSTGEAWDETSWQWFFNTVGGARCPIINMSGGTDIMGGFLSPLPLHSLKACTLGGPGLGMAVDVWNDDGEPVRERIGYLVATKPTPSMTRSLWNDRERYLENYWSRWPDVWNHGDWARVDQDGHWFILGRADGALKVAGRRTGPAEIEGALLATGKVREAVVIGVPHEVKGEGIVCFVVLNPGNEPSEELREELSMAVVGRLGMIDRPEEILFVRSLPRTSSSKIPRRLVQERYLGRRPSDASAVENPEALDEISRAK